MQASCPMFFGFNPAYTVYAVNIPLLIICYIILVQILKEKSSLTLSSLTLLLDGCIILSSLLVFDAERIFYATLNIFFLLCTISLLELGTPNDLNIFVISKRQDEIVVQVRYRLIHTIALLQGRGGYSQEDQDVLFFVINHFQYQEFLEIIEELDLAAFIVVNTAGELKGRAFSLERNYMENINRV